MFFYSTIYTPRVTVTDASVPGAPVVTSPTANAGAGPVHPTKSEKNEKVPKTKGNGTQLLYTNFG